VGLRFRRGTTQICALWRQAFRPIVERKEDPMHRITCAAPITLAALAASVTLGACGDAPDSPAIDLAGRWKSACTDPGGGQAIRLSFDLTPDAWALDYANFGDAACAAPALTVHIEGPYAVTGASATVAGAYEARFGFARKTVTPSTDGAAVFLAQACGGGTFTAGAATDIAGGCAGLGMYPLASCAADYDLVARAGDRLQFGARPADNDMCTEARRPTALSPILLARE
jgi:hypothetical protein